MMKHPLHLVALAAAALLSAAANAQMYKWVNEDGSTTYSNQPPSGDEGVQEFTKIEIPMAKPAPEPPTIAQPAPPPAPAIQPPSQNALAEPTQRAVEATVPKQEGDAPRPRPSVRSMLPQAVQDPCLRSSDPLCHEKNKDRYKPYVGYAPKDAAVGATSSAGAGGTVTGGTRAK